jgi:hypothetical protein
LVTITSPPVAAISSISSRHVALKTLAAIVGAAIGDVNGAETRGLVIRVSRVVIIL